MKTKDFSAKNWKESSSCPYLVCGWTPEN